MKWETGKDFCKKGITITKDSRGGGYRLKVENLSANLFGGMLSRYAFNGCFETEETAIRYASQRYGPRRAKGKL